MTTVKMKLELNQETPWAQVRLEGISSGAWWGLVGVARLVD